VKNLFSQFGTVVSVKIINDRAGVPRGYAFNDHTFMKPNEWYELIVCQNSYGFVTYETEEDAKRVMKESDNLLIKNRKLNISVAIKKQQHFSNGLLSADLLARDKCLPMNTMSFADVNVRNHSNGSFIYSPYSIVNAASNTLYPEIVYTSDGIPVYNLGAAGQLMANCGVSSPQTSYPYTTYQTPSGLYLATTQPSLATQQFPQFQTSAGASPPAAGYPLLATPYRLPLNSQVCSH
jgi:RNA recognition motif-containing protein